MSSTNDTDIESDPSPIKKPAVVNKKTATKSKAAKMPSSATEIKTAISDDEEFEERSPPKKPAPVKGVGKTKSKVMPPSKVTSKHASDDSSDERDAEDDEDDEDDDDNLHDVEDIVENDGIVADAANANMFTPGFGLPSNHQKRNHPKVSEMILAAVVTMKDRRGSSLQAIKKYMQENYSVDMPKLNIHVKKNIVKMVEGGQLVQVHGHGANGSFKIGAVAKVKKPTKAAAAKSIKAIKAPKMVDGPTKKVIKAKSKPEEKSKLTPEKKAKKKLKNADTDDDVPAKTKKSKVKERATAKEKVKSKSTAPDKKSTKSAKPNLV